MIKELKLKNWKSFEEATLYIDPLTILIGTNASGKSNLLDAFLFLNRVSSGVGIFQAINGDVNLPQLRSGLEWVCRKPGTRFSLEIIVDGLKNSQISLLTQMEDIQQLPKLMAGGSLGRIATQGRIEAALKTSGNNA